MLNELSMPAKNTSVYLLLTMSTKGGKNFPAFACINFDGRWFRIRITPLEVPHLTVQMTIQLFAAISVAS